MMVEKRQSSSRAVQGYTTGCSPAPEPPCLPGEGAQLLKDRQGVSNRTGAARPPVGSGPVPQASALLLPAQSALGPNLGPLLSGSKDGSTTTFGLDGISDLPSGALRSQPENQRDEERERRYYAWYSHTPAQDPGVRATKCSAGGGWTGLGGRGTEGRHAQVHFSL